MIDFPRSLIEFQHVFPDECACAAYLADARWPDGFRCPDCGDDKGWQLSTKGLRDFVQHQRQTREHDGWFRGEVEQGMREADDPGTRRISQEDAREGWRRQRAELVKRATGRAE